MARLLIVLVLAALTAACGPPAASSGGPAGPPGSEASTPAGGSSVAGMCVEEEPDCVDMVVEPAGDGDAMPDKQLRASARDLLGVAEGDLPPEVRVGRRGDEQFALTEDYRVGRMTVELDQDVDSIYRVTAVTVELAEGPKTVTVDQ